MPNDMDFFDFLSQHSLEDVLSAIIQYQLENLMYDGEQLSLAEYAAANALYACPQNGISPLTRNAYINLKSILGSLPNDYALVLISEAIKRKESSNVEKASFLQSTSMKIDSIKKDVKQAIGNAFQQALRSIRYVEDGKEFLSSSSQKIKLKNTSSKYIVCVTAEHFGNVPSETTF